MKVPAAMEDGPQRKQIVLFILYKPASIHVSFGQRVVTSSGEKTIQNELYDPVREPMTPGSKAQLRKRLPGE
ncbi:inward rectifier potassium channel 4 [Platysternon megacephalum]|uniref:Inward rectifier potassium channel 4 n=1 Tax=Platysternon megacephalum TaxID=55544 RepID=A0A4D9EA12_9SAUR|nr:inward rectifier potassium channel 4 [Platysternon megacephalum]